VSGRKSFKRLRDKINANPERRARVEELERTYDIVLALADLREQFGVTQRQLAESLDVSQPNISKIEQQHDLLLSTLAAYVEGLGGHLELKAVFPDHTWSLIMPDPHQDHGRDHAGV
jgi:DNA-binding XRE family transcriptional regulator